MAREDIVHGAQVRFIGKHLPGFKGGTVVGKPYDGLFGRTLVNVRLPCKIPGKISTEVLPIFIEDLEVGAP